jgi:hypothetical protein
MALTAMPSRLSMRSVLTATEATVSHDIFDLILRSEHQPRFLYSYFPLGTGELNVVAE